MVGGAVVLAVLAVLVVLAVVARARVCVCVRVCAERVRFGVRVEGYDRDTLC